MPESARLPGRSGADRESGAHRVGSKWTWIPKGQEPKHIQGTASLLPWPLKSGRRGSSALTPGQCPAYSTSLTEGTDRLRSHDHETLWHLWAEVRLWSIVPMKWNSGHPTSRFALMFAEGARSEASEETSERAAIPPAVTHRSRPRTPGPSRC